ncbi:hypothetical protein PP483_gp54 [Gordonia phage Bunnybear]|uniref:Uncharacterized protein n=1 Tax=Gordonia phage Bunnybear TaxID=2762398 RepID=A0A7G8LLI8_9CAUD|nr:hypothetical protein PP483_gp54 [Gordonia phage Bunnybear]QNJ58110.1 hypothetical protein SEA_BUNNYBEAR_54 [Gordonia phage Bunnybear]
MSSATSAPVPIRRAVGDFPSDRPTTFTDGYGRSQVLVPIEECDRLTEERDDLARRVMEAADALSVGLPGGALVGGRGLVIAARRLADDRDRWKSDCEKARARWTSPIGPRERWAGEAAELIPFPRPYNDLHQIQVDYLRAIEVSSSGPTPEERQERRQKVFEAAMSLVYEVTHLRAQVTDLKAKLADERVVDAVVIDHTDPDQIRRAAGVIEGLGMDLGVTYPENYWMSPATLRRRAQLAEQ